MMSERADRFTLRSFVNFPADTSTWLRPRWPAGASADDIGGIKVKGGG